MSKTSSKKTAKRSETPPAKPTTARKPRAKKSAPLAPQRKRPGASNPFVKALPVAMPLHEHLLKTVHMVERLQVEFKESIKAGAIPAAHAFVIMRRLKDQFEDVGGVYSAVFAEGSNKLMPELFDEEGVPSIPLSSGHRVTCSAKLQASLKASARAEGIAWLEANGLGAIVQKSIVVSDLDEKDQKALVKFLEKRNLSNRIVGTVNPQTIAATARALRSDANKDLPEEYFSCADVWTTTVNNPRKS